MYNSGQTWQTSANNVCLMTITKNIILVVVVASTHMYGGCARRRCVVNVSDTKNIQCSGAETFEHHRHNESSQVFTAVVRLVTSAPVPVSQQAL